MILTIITPTSTIIYAPAIRTTTTTTAKIFH